MEGSALSKSGIAETEPGSTPGAHIHYSTCSQVSFIITSITICHHRSSWVCGDFFYLKFRIDSFIYLCKSSYVVLRIEEQLKNL